MECPSGVCRWITGSIASTIGWWRERSRDDDSLTGEPFPRVLPPFACVAIYTGAELPSGADSVVMVEHTRREGGDVLFTGAPKRGQNVSHRAEILAVDGPVFEPRRRLSAVDLSVLATVGCDPVQVFRRPRVSILTTGDELVPVREKPGPRSRRVDPSSWTERTAASSSADLPTPGSPRSTRLPAVP